MDYCKNGKILHSKTAREQYFLETNTILPLFEDGLDDVEQHYIAAGYIPVQYEEKPEVAPYQKLVENEPVIADGVCYVSFRVEHKSDEEIFRLRQRAYQTESDPLYMEWLYDQTDEKYAEWKSRVQQIKARYPKKN
ncbi:hypothetical protein [Seleniivibrio woodruffii]|uniref:Uncharacterized protein n=1 Tax=Seleniivibrio woodruffii TaxID=1078050 RepID=A0A4R1K2U9_9BACT|nr:hypothetical protein [Seleniivibrio woodruffii]TCK58167.1 hypothetical protein C8D98_2745 [Seleniivibrio woodruffii]TVZ35707.1 hypothetical protein OF66_1323 [Seleniivibrio woodruffii]